MRGKFIKKLLACVTTLAMASQLAVIMPASAAEYNDQEVDVSKFTQASNLTTDYNEETGVETLTFTGNNQKTWSKLDLTPYTQHGEEKTTKVTITYTEKVSSAGRTAVGFYDEDKAIYATGGWQDVEGSYVVYGVCGQNIDKRVYLNGQVQSNKNFSVDSEQNVTLEIDFVNGTISGSIGACELPATPFTELDSVDTLGVYSWSATTYEISDMKITTETTNETYYDVVYSIDGTNKTESVKEGEYPAEVPTPSKLGYIFKGWNKDGDTSTLLSSDDISAAPVTADVTYTAVFEKDASYIEPIVSAEIVGNESMTIGPDENTPADNNYTLLLKGELGTVITAENIDDRIEDFNIEWDIDGFKTVNDITTYCDGYGNFAGHSSTATDVTFQLKKNASMNFFGRMTATVVYNGETIEASKYVVAMSNTDREASRILPEGGYPSDFDDYPDALIGYETSAETYDGDDLIIGGWNMAGSDADKKAVLSEEDGNKFISIHGINLKKSHMFSYNMVSPATQVIFEQDIRFTNTASITSTSGYAIWQDKRYAEAISINFDGSTATINGVKVKDGDADAKVEKSKWYKVVVSIDKTTETAFVKIYDKDGAFVGEALNVPWITSTDPTYYSVGMPNEAVGTVDFDNYKAYYPTLDESKYTLSTSSDTLSIPNGDTAELTASAKTAEGYEITGKATWSVLEDDMRESIVITPDANDSHKATVSLSDTAVPGAATIQVNIGGYTKNIVLNLTSSAESVKFTSYTTSVSIPVEQDETTVADYKAIVIDGNGTDLERDVRLEIYDKNNVDIYTLPDGIAFDAETGRLTVEADAKPCTFTIRATGQNSDGENISRSIKVTVHGLAFDFGAGTDEDIVEGYTSVTPETIYTETNGYGITGVAQAGGTGSVTDAASDYLEGNIGFKVNVPAGAIYTVDITYQGTLISEYVSGDLAGVSLGTQNTLAEATYTIPVVDNVMDFTISASADVPARIASIVITKQDAKTPEGKTQLYTIGDSTLKNNGSWAYYIAGNIAKYPQLTDLVVFNNSGRGGSNLKKYYESGDLNSILISIKPGDVVTLGNMGTNLGYTTADNVNYYCDAIETFGGKIILNSYSPHGAVGGYEYVYNSETHTFNGWRQDDYDVVIRAIAAERAESDPNYLGFVEIGKNADAAFNAYVADYANNGYDSADEAAQAIIACFTDHNHYNGIASQLMVEGYGDVPGIVAQLVDILSAQPEESGVSAAYDGTAAKVQFKNLDGTNAVIYVAEYAEDGTLKAVEMQNVAVSGADVTETVEYTAENAENVKVFVWTDNQAKIPELQ